MAHDREFQRKQKDTRMPVRDSHREDRMISRQTEQDFDLWGVRDAPSSGSSRNHRQDIPAQMTEDISQNIPETPQVNYGAEILSDWADGGTTVQDSPFSRFSETEPARTESRSVENGRRNFRQNDSGQVSFTESAPLHDTRRYGEKSFGAYETAEKSVEPEQRHQIHQHGNKYQQRFHEAAKSEEQAMQAENGSGSEPKKTSKLEFAAKNCRRKQRIKNRCGYSGKQTGPQKSWTRHSRVCLPGKSCTWKPFLTRRLEKQKNA